MARGHLLLARQLAPLTSSSDSRAVARMESIKAGHQLFCVKQLENKKTARVLDSALGPEFTEPYMSQLMFDYDPQDDPQWFDASISKMYSYFQTAPEPSDTAKELAALRRDIDMKTAGGYLADFMSGRKPVNQARLEWALEFLFKHDASFHAAVKNVLPGDAQELMDSGQLGSVLLQQLKGGQRKMTEKWTK